MAYTGWRGRSGFKEAGMVKVSTIIIVVLLALLAAHSIIVLVEPAMVLEGDFQAMAGKSYQGELGPDAVRVSLVHIRHMEVNGITAATAAFFILFAGFRREKKWAWWAMLIVGVIALGFGTVLNLVIGNMFDFAIFVVALVVYMVAVFLPIKKFFTKAG
jgi:hypothetical protein